MISFGSRVLHAEMSKNSRSHQLGEGHEDSAKMSIVLHPSRLVYGGQKSATGTSPRHRLHQLGKGHQCGAAMPTWTHPSQLVLQRPRHSSRKVMLTSPLKGRVKNRSQQCQHGYTLPHQFTEAKNPPQDRHTDPASTSLREGHPECTEMSSSGHPLTSFGPCINRRDAMSSAPNFNQRPNRVRRNALYRTPRNQGDPIWIQDMKTRLSHK